MVWMAPAVQTLAAPAFAAGSTAPGGGEVEDTYSEILLLVHCGSSYYRYKFEPGDADSAGPIAPSEDGKNFNFGGCSDDFFRGDSSVTTDGAPYRIAGTLHTDGSVDVTLDSGCQLLAVATHKGGCCFYLKHAGAVSAQTPLAPGTYGSGNGYDGVTVGATGNVTFGGNPPNGNNRPCPVSP